MSNSISSGSIASGSSSSGSIAADLQQAFAAAQEAVKTLSERPAPPTLLRLYALYKQGSHGDVRGDAPSAFDFVAKAKYDAWLGEAGKDQAAAMQEYVDLVQSLISGE